MAPLKITAACSAGTIQATEKNGLGSAAYKAQRQQGVALVVALVFLLAMTAIGVSSFVNTTLQERMVNSSRQSDLSVQSAIVAARAAEQWLSGWVAGDLAQIGIFSQGCKGLYQPYQLETIGGMLLASNPAYIFPVVGPKSFDLYDDQAWDENANSRSVPGVLAADSTAKDPQYIIELVGVGEASTTRSMGREFTELGQNSDPDDFDVQFRITAMGWGRDEAISSMIQSTVKMTLSDVGNGVTTVCP